MNNKKFRAVLLMFILVIMSVGCSGEKDPKEEVQEKLKEESTADGSTVSDISVDNYVIESGPNSFMEGVKINVNITMPEYDISKLSVYKQEILDINDENIAKYAKEIFGDNYTILKPYGAYTWDELNIAEQECNELRELYNSYEVPYPIMYKRDKIKFYKENFDETFVINEMPEGQIMCPVASSFGLMNNGDECSEGLIEGEIDGEIWQMRVFVSLDSNFMQLVRTIDGLEDVEEVEEQYFETSQGAELAYGENTFKYTKEEAEIMAEEFAEGMGYDNLRAIKTLNLSRGNEALGGYVFIFARVQDGLVSASKFYDFMVMDAYDGYGYGGDDLLSVYVGSNGVYKVKFGMKTEITKDIEELSFLDVEKVKTIAKDQFNTLINFESGDVNITKVELRYASIFIPESGTYLIPVWFFFAEEYRQAPYIGINALDGSIVYSYTYIGVGDSKIINSSVQGDIDYEDEETN